MSSMLTAIGAYGRTATLPSLAEPSEGTATGPSFGDMVKASLSQAVQTQRTSEAVSAQAVMGKADPTQVAAAVTNAEVTLQTVIAVRDKVVGAYQDIMRMAI